LISDTNLQKCRAKNCPRIKHAHGGSCLHHKNSCTVTRNSESEHDWDYKQWIILLLTVCIQIVVLFGTVIFILTNKEESSEANNSLAQVTVNKGMDLYLSHSTPTTASLPESAKSGTVKPGTVKSGTVKPGTVKPEPAKLKPAVTDLAKEPSVSVTNTPQSQKPKKNTASNKLSQTEPVENKPEITSPLPIQPAFPLAMTTAEPVTTGLATSESTAEKFETQKTVTQNEEDKFENVKLASSLPETAQMKPEEAVKIPLKKENATNKLLPKAIRIAAAEVLLEESVTLLVSDPEQSLKDILSAVATFKELGHSVPSTAYWILGQAYASLSWGKMFLINTPSVENMTISSDSHWLLTQCQDNSVWIWDLFRNQNNRNGVLLDSGRIPYVKLVFSPDLRLIIGGRTDGTLQIWDMARSNPAETPVMLKEKVIGLRDLQISPDGCWLAAFGGSMSSSLEVARNNRYMDSAGTSVSVETAFGENENYFCNLNEPIPPCRIVRLHSKLPLPDMVYGTPMISEKISAEERPANEIPVKMIEKSVLREQPFWSRENIQVSFLSEYSTIEQEKPLPKVKTELDAVTVLSEPHAVWLWDLRQIQNGFIPPPIVLRGHKKEIRLIQFSADSGKLAVGGKDSTTLIYNLREGAISEIPLILRGHELDITAIAFAPNSSWVATGSRDNTVRLWNLTDSKRLPDSVVLNAHRGWISSLLVNQSGTQLFSGSYDKTIRVWRLDRNDIKTAAEREPLVLQSNQGVIQELFFSPDGKKLVSLGGDNSLRIRNIVEGIIDDRHSMIFRNRMLPISKIAFTPDNRWLVFGYKNQKNPANSGIRLWPLNFDQLIQIAAENE
jgi:WD40 repeat protein